MHSGESSDQMKALMENFKFADDMSIWELFKFLIEEKVENAKLLMFRFQNINFVRNF